MYIIYVGQQQGEIIVFWQPRTWWPLKKAPASKSVQELLEIEFLELLRKGIEGHSSLSITRPVMLSDGQKFALISIMDGGEEFLRVGIYPEWLLFQIFPFGLAHEFPFEESALVGKSALSVIASHLMG